MNFIGIYDANKNLSLEEKHLLLKFKPIPAILKETPLLLCAGKSTFEQLDKIQLAWNDEIIYNTKNKSELNFGLSIEVIQNKLICHRGSIGHIPFLYRFHEGVLYFARFMKDLLTLTQKIPTQINTLKVTSFLQMTMFDANSTFYSNIERLEAGGVLSIMDGTLQCDWSHPSFQNSKDINPNTLKENLISNMKSLPSNTGCMVSGGIDSTTLAAIYSSFSNKKTSCFHFSIEDNQEDTQLAYQATEHCNFELNEINISQWDPLQFITKDIEIFGEPHFHPNNYMFHQVGNLAIKKGIQSIIDGSDGDSVFSRGHELILRNFSCGNLLKTLKYAKILKELEQVTYPFIFKHWLIKPLLPPKVSANLFYSQMKIPEWINKDLLSETIYLEKEIQFLELEKQRYANNEHQKDLFSPINQHILELTDCTNYHSELKWKYPYYDPKIVNMGMMAPENWRINQGHERYLLRSVADQFLPKEVTWRKGKGSLGSGISQGLYQHSQLLEKWEDIKPFTSEFIYAQQFENSLNLYLKNPSYFLAIRIWPVFVLGYWLKNLKSRANTL